MALEPVTCKICGAALYAKPGEVGPFLCWRHDTMYYRGETFQDLVTHTPVPTEPVPPAPAQVGPPRRLRPKRMMKQGKLTPAGRVMLSRQGGVCALCGVPGWGTVKGNPLKTGALLRARCGTQVMGIYCRPCAALVQRLRVKVTRYCEAKRGPSGDGPRDQGGSR